MADLYEIGTTTGDLPAKKDWTSTRRVNRSDGTKYIFRVRYELIDLPEGADKQVVAADIQQFLQDNATEEWDNIAAVLLD